MKMNKILLTALILISSNAIAQTQYFYGPNGQYQGQALQSGTTQFFYGADGQYQGQAFRNGNTTSLYGANGQYQGQTFSNTPTVPVYTPPTQSLTPMFDSIFGR